MQSASNLAVNPSVNFRGAESPEFPDVNPSNASKPGESLKRFRMNLHDRCGFIRIQQGFKIKCAWYSSTAIVRSHATRRFFRWEIVVEEQADLLGHR
jgi:hypothetical protein